MKSTIQREESGNIVLHISIPWETVQKTYENVLVMMTESAELPGFRKGKAPKEKVEESLDKTKTYEEVLRKLLPEAFSLAVKEHSIKPIVSPQITLEKAKEHEDWVVKAVTCERPSIELGSYKEAIKALKAEKRNKIWVPGEDKKTDSPNGKQDEKEKKPTLDEILKALYSSVKLTLPPILLQQETTRLLSGLIDETKKLGLTVEQYITSTGRTSDQLKKEYEEEARRTLTLEFAISDIAEKEQINVEEKDIDEIIKTAKTEEEKKSLEHERYYLASVLRRQKTIQHLAGI